MRWSYLKFTVTSRTRARDLQWRFDAVRRLRDAQAGVESMNVQDYIEPSVLWWAFDASSARWAGEEPPGHGGQREHRYPGAHEVVDGVEVDKAVVLIDEIDKADPDLPNDLLESMGARRFTVDDNHFEVVDSQGPFLVITSNQERDLPQAFLRRCVSLTLAMPHDEWMLDIGRSHFPEVDERALAKIYEKFQALSVQANEAGARAPSTAEFLDTLAAFERLGIDIETSVWESVTRTTLLKQGKDWT
jgi:MoxR-like ATPase